MRYLCVLLAACELGGCFVYVPGGLFAKGNTCVGESMRVGQLIANTKTGKTGKITEIIGRSERCQDGALPILVTVQDD